MTSLSNETNCTMQLLLPPEPCNVGGNVGANYPTFNHRPKAIYH